MEKKELKNYLNVIVGELKNDISNEEGCFDEIATNALERCFECGDILSNDTKVPTIVLCNNIETICMPFIWIDGIVKNLNNEVIFKTSDEDDIFNTELNEIDRDYIIDVIEEIINMCD